MTSDSFQSSDSAIFWPSDRIEPPLRDPGHIGPFKILGRLGEGGMGVVFLAEQRRPVRRNVALKVIKPGMDTREVIARFESERQALAMMDHPNVAHVFDAGTTEQQRPYFVMEHVEGVAVTKYCDQHSLTTTQRMQIFIDVCRAIQHAHQKGIIHRDIKPSNILVTIQDDKPIPKVIDFGVAKATASRLTEKTLFTEQGQLIGTPEYMSPEQVEMTALNIDTRSDVYSLGVLLYELLVGALPFDPDYLRKQSYLEIQRIIREEEPPKPSKRLIGLGTDSTPAADKRRTNAPTLLRQLRGDLDWITMKAMDKDRSRRYATASELAADIERFLSDEPVLARSPSFLYRLRKTVKRHRFPITAGAAVFSALVAGLVVSTMMYVNAEWAGYRANISAANNAMLLFDCVEASQHLDAVSARFMNTWEWRYLHGQLDQSIATLDGNHGEVLHTAFSAGGKRLVSGATDGSITIWDMASRASVHTLKGHEHRVSCLAVSTDGETLASGSVDGIVRLWETSTGKKLGEFEPISQPVQPVQSVAFSPDGKTLISGVRWMATADPYFTIWDLESHELLKTVAAHRHGINSIAFTLDGTRFVTGGEDGRLMLWDTNTYENVRSWKPHNWGINSIAIAPDGMTCVSGAKDRRIMLTALETHGESRELGRHESSIEGVAASPDGSLFASASSDRTMKVWSATTSDLVATLCGHQDVVRSVAFSPDGPILASSSDDGTLRLWGVPSHAASPLDARGDDNVKDKDVYALEFASNGEILATGCRDGTVKIWDVATRDLLCAPWNHSNEVKAARFSSDGRRLVIATGYYEREGALFEWSAPDEWETARPEQVRAIDTSGALKPVNQRAALSPDGGMLASANEADTVWVWDTRGDSASLLFPLAGHNEKVAAIEFSANGRVIATGASDKTVRLWDAETGDELAVICNQGGAVADVAFSQDGTLVASASPDRFVRVWNIKNRSPVAELPHPHAVTCVVFSPKRRRMASGSVDGTVRIWDPKTESEVLTLRGHTAIVTHLRFSPNGDTLASGSADGEVRLWVAESPEGR